MTLLLIVAFVSGLVTILAPCIWPLLPIILSSSALGGRGRAFGISLGIVSSFAIFTLVIAYLVSSFHFDPSVLRIFAVLVIGFLGLTLAVPALSRRLEAQVSKLSGKLGSFTTRGKSGFWGGLTVGVALGIVWTPCAGPILAAIATLAATRAVNFQIVIVTLVYSLGVGIPLFLFASAGSWVFKRSSFVNKYTGRIQQVFGVVMILTALAIYTNYDKVLQAKLLDAFPAYSTFLIRLESGQTVKQQLDVIKGKESEGERRINLQNFGPAPEFIGINRWLNAEPLSLEELKGKVVLIDFWTYTCINCIRTLPYVTHWWEKYNNSSLCPGTLRSFANESLPAGLADKCLVVIGVHTPEFEFEKKTENVADALSLYKITYPVAQDNDYQTWDAYDNRYWPAKYLIDAQGNIRYVHFGEGKYEETEMVIKKLIEEAGGRTDDNLVRFPDQTPQGRQTPETYLGANRMERFGSLEEVRGGVQNFTAEGKINDDYFAFEGEWAVQDEFASSRGGSQILFNFNAQKVFLVMEVGKVGGKVKVYLDGKLVDDLSGGADVKDGEILIDENRVYELLDLDRKSKHLLRLEFTGETKVYAFTFG